MTVGIQVLLASEVGRIPFAGVLGVQLSVPVIIPMIK